MCPWNDDLAVQVHVDDAVQQRPTAAAPFVYHLFGRLTDPESLVLTEDNYFDFLMGITANRTLIPDFVIGQLAQSALLFLGFRLDEWDFRVLFRSLMNQEGRSAGAGSSTSPCRSTPRRVARSNPTAPAATSRATSAKSASTSTGGARTTSSTSLHTAWTRAAQVTAIADRLGTNPYVGPRVPAGETLYGRDREVLDLIDLVVAERIVLLYSPSGAGKTSLIQAALIPALEEEDFVVLPIMRVSDEHPGVQDLSPPPNRYVLSALTASRRRARRRPADRPSLASHVLRPTTSTAPYPPDEGHVVIVIDQLEEVIPWTRPMPPSRSSSSASWARRCAIHGGGRCCPARGLRRRARPLHQGVPTRLSRRYRLDLLGPACGVRSSTAPAQAAGVAFYEEAARR